MADLPSWTIEELLARAEETLTEIKVNQGLSEPHAAVLAALRIRLTGTESKSLEEMLEAAEEPRTDRFAGDVRGGRGQAQGIAG